MDGEVGEDDEPARCALGELCIGPVLSLGAINPIGIGVHARYGDYIGFGFDYQFLPTLTFSNASASWSLITVEARVYPFGGSFFLGGGFGYQTLNAERQHERPARRHASRRRAASTCRRSSSASASWGATASCSASTSASTSRSAAPTSSSQASVANAPPETMADLRQQHQRRRRRRRQPRALHPAAEPAALRLPVLGPVRPSPSVRS